MPAIRDIPVETAKSGERCEAPALRVLCVLRWPVGGIRSYLLNNYAPLLQQGFRFSFVGPAGPEFSEFCDQVNEWPNTRVYPAPVTSRGCALRRTVRMALKSGRYSLLHSQGMIAAVAGVFANVGTGLPHISTSHYTFQPEVHFAGLTGRIKREAMGHILSRLNALVTVSEDARENHLQCVPRLRNSRCKVVTIASGINTDRFSATVPAIDRNALRRQCGIRDDSFLFGYFGRFMEVKGFPVLIDAMEYLVRTRQDFRGHLLAVGSGDFEREYKRETESRGLLNNRVTFLPFQTDIAPLLRQVDTVVIPSLREAGPLLPMESLCLGAPVIGTRCIGLREVLAGTPAMMVEPGDAGALAQALLKAQDDDRAMTFAQYVPVARKRFNADDAASRLAAVMTALARI